MVMVSDIVNYNFIARTVTTIRCTSKALGMNTKYYGAIVLFVAVLSTVSAQHRVEVVVTGISDTTGVIMVGLFVDAKTFLKKPARGVVVKAKNGQAVAVYDGVPSGRYAVSIIHDANRNGKLDSNLLGIPKEGFGFSNDAMGTFGPPSFEKAGFNVSAPVIIRIKARYL